MKKMFFLILYAVFLLLFVEFTCRLFWTIHFHEQLWTPDALAKKIRSLESFYPQLKTIKPIEISRNDDTYDILILSASVFNSHWGNISALLEKKLQVLLKRPVRLFNMAEGAHTSRDSLFKYQALREKQFDLVIIYHGMNEVRANNCPPELYQEDYSHYSWYREINFANSCDRHPRWITPITLSYLQERILSKLDSSKTVPTNWPKEEWTKWGYLIRTPAVFGSNLSEILRLARQKREQIMLLSYAYYVSPNYSREAFEAKSLDYVAYMYPVELWGKPEYVLKALDAHNEVIRKLAGRFPEVWFLDQNKLMPKEGRFFNDICHLSPAGCELFTNYLSAQITEHVDKSNGVL